MRGGQLIRRPKYWISFEKRVVGPISPKKAPVPIVSDPLDWIIYPTVFPISVEYLKFIAYMLMLPEGTGHSEPW